MKYFLYLLILFCCSCQEKTLWQGKELCRQLIESHTISFDTILPILRKAEELSPVEHYGVICQAVSSCNISVKHEMAEKCLQTWDSLQPFPRIHNKAEGFFLMEKFAYKALHPRQKDPEWLSVLLFDMENRYRLTPEERCRLLILKSGIFYQCFREYESAASIAREAEAYAHQHGISGKLLQEIYQMLFQSYLQSEKPEKNITLTQDMLTSIENNRGDTTFQKLLYQQLTMLYRRQGNYQKAWYYDQKSGKEYIRYHQAVVDTYLNIDSISLLRAYLKKIQNLELQRIEKMSSKEKHTVRNFLLSNINYAKALALLHQGDSIGYQHSLDTSIRYCDLISSPFYLPQMETYIQLLWKQGKRNEAIRRMEKFCQVIVHQKNIFTTPHKTNVINAKNRLSQMQLLTSYYRAAGRSEEALRQALCCDSLQTLYADTRLNLEQCNNASRMYTADLSRNLEQQRANYAREQQRQAFTATLLGLAILAAVGFAWLYRRRQRELNIFYAKQKVIEQLETSLSENRTQTTPQDIPADKQLYLCLERQMLTDRLYLNPDFSRDDLCRLAGSNRMYVSTCINKYAEMNLNQWINKARVNHAISLIHTGETNLQVLASDSGFSSTTSFFRNFKQFTLLTPKQYIEREKK